MGSLQRGKHFKETFFERRVDRHRRRHRRHRRRRPWKSDRVAAAERAVLEFSRKKICF